MTLKICVTFLLVLLFVRNNGIERGMSLTNDEDWKLEKIFKILNKQPINSIQDEVGALYDCINIYEQPAFNHSQLRYHKIQMQPTTLPKDFVNEISTKVKPSDIGVKHIRCPQGTVPIRRTRKEDLLRTKSFTESYSFFPNNVVNPGKHHAVVRRTNSKEPIFGSGAQINVITPKVAHDQASLALITLGVGQPGDELIIQAGWAVAPQIYGDQNPHLFISWAENTGCYTILCPGFVQVDQNHPVDMLLDSSVYNETQHEIIPFVYQDRVSKNWWVALPSQGITLGYWPSELIPRLNDGARTISWGGIARNPLKANGPPMAYGEYPNYPNFKFKAGYFVNIKILYDGNDLRVPDDGDWESYTDSPNWCYDVKNYKFQHNENEYSISYGGPGGACKS